MLTDRALNRALLARQGLLESWDCPPLQAIERLVGLQTQSPLAPYFGLRSRLPDFEPAQLSQLLLDRSVVRLVLMRGTLHLVTAADCIAFRPVLQGDLLRVALAGGRLADVDLAAVVAAAEEALEAGPLTFAGFWSLLAPQFPHVAKDDLNRLVRCLLPLVQVTPRGVWGQTMAATHTTVSRWLGRSVASETAPDELVLRYLAAFGPSSVADVTAWSGLTGVRACLSRLSLRTFTDERGRQLFDVPDGLLPDASLPVPVRIIAEFDNLLLAHADRHRIFDDRYRPRIMSVNGIVSSTFLVDGFVAGTCRLSRAAGAATLTCTPFGRLRRSDRTSLEAEAERVLAFAAPEASHRVVVTASG